MDSSMRGKDRSEGGQREEGTGTFLHDPGSSIGGPFMPDQDVGAAFSVPDGAHGSGQGWQGKDKGSLL